MTSDASPFKALMSRLFPDMKGVCQRIDEEIETHLAMSSEAAIRDGVSAEDAYRDAVLRFGDPSAVRAELIEIALRPRRRLVAAAGLAACAALALSVGLVGVVHSRSTRMGQTIAELDLALRQERARSSVVSSARFLEPAQTVHIVRIDGAVGKPRTWTISRDEPVTVRQLLARSRVLEAETTGLVFVIPFRDSDAIWSARVSDWTDPDEPDRLITESCTIMVERRLNHPA